MSPPGQSMSATLPMGSLIVMTVRSKALRRNNCRVQGLLKKSETVATVMAD